MIPLKSREEIKLMTEAGAILRDVREQTCGEVAPGVTTQQLDDIARKLIKEAGVIPAFLGYEDYPACICASINEEIVHGLPSDRELVEGDIVTIDVGIIKDGFYLDSAKTCPVGKIDNKSQNLLEITKEALDASLEFLTPGRLLNELTEFVQMYVGLEKHHTIESFGGHGVGRELHEYPFIPYHTPFEENIMWRSGMVVAHEPMVAIGTSKAKKKKDGWTVVTEDGSRSAHFEHTIAILDHGPVILT